MSRPDGSVTDAAAAVPPDARLAAIVDCSFDAIISKDLDGIIMSWNAAARNMFGYTPEEAVGRSILILIPETHRDEEADIIARIRKGERVPTFETVRRRKDGTLIPVSLTISPIRGPDGRLFGASKIARDISATKETEAQIALLLREVHHRVKNNLQMVASLVQLQPMPADLKRDLRGRIMAMAAVHEHLHRADNRGRVELARYIEGVIQSVNLGFGGAVRTQLELEPVFVDADTATPVGLIVNELISNTNKYAFAGTAPGTFRARLEKTGEPGRARLSLANDGVPFDASAKADGVGVKLIRNLAAAIDPEFRLDGTKGLAFAITIPTMP